MPVFLADVKGDLSGHGERRGRPVTASPPAPARWDRPGRRTAYPTEFLSLGGHGRGVPVRATVTSFGPTLLAKVLGLNAIQESSLGLVFHYADRAAWRCWTSRTCAR